MKYYFLVVSSLYLNLSIAAPEPTNELTVFEKFEGVWSYNDKDKPFDCSEDPHTITFNLDKQEAYFNWIESKELPSEKTTYSILKHTNKVIRMQMHGETRKDSEGHLVIWDLLKVSNNKYTWHRKDWPSGGSTGYFFKCNQPQNKK